MIFEESYTLNNGIKIPKLGLGTWFIPDEKADQAVKDAVTVGYRLIDTAQAYGNEAGIGKGIRECGVGREEIFVTSKIAAEAKNYDLAMKSIDETLEKMKLDYLDMMIIHSPQPWKEFRNDENRYFKENCEVWRALEDAYTAGKLKAIGLSNFLVDDLDNILSHCRISPMVNQILLHVGNVRTEVIEHSVENNILVEAYSPIAHGEILNSEGIVRIAQKYGVSVSALCIRYVLQLGTVALPKTANIEHMRDNAKVDFIISENDMAVLNEMEPLKDYGEFTRFPVFSGK